MTLKNTTLTVNFETGILGSAVQGNQPGWNGVLSLVQSFTDGTTANKADLVYLSERTVTTGANDDIDVAGALSDALGNTITAAEIVAVIVVNAQRDGTANTTDLTIGGDGSTGVVGFTSAVATIGPGGVFMVMTPDAGGQAAVTASTADILRITNASGASNTYQIAILARSA